MKPRVASLFSFSLKKGLLLAAFVPLSPPCRLLSAEPLPYKKAAQNEISASPRDTTSAMNTGISLRLLEIAVREAKVGSVMITCNHVKGEPTFVSEETGRPTV